MAAVGMSVPGASDIGYGAALGDDLSTETDEQRRKKLLEQAQRTLLPNSTMAGASSLGLLPGGYGAAGKLGQ